MDLERSGREKEKGSVNRRLGKAWMKSWFGKKREMGWSREGKALLQLGEGIFIILTYVGKPFRNPL